MSKRDGLSALQMVNLGRLTLSGTTAAASDWVDTRDFDAVTLVPLTTTVTDAGTIAGGFTFEIQESDTDAAADATAVADAQLLNTEESLRVTSDDADDTVVGPIGYLGTKRFVRAVVTGTTNTNAEVIILAVNGYPHNQPTTFVGTAVAAT